jgi:hypothetical protein
MIARACHAAVTAADRAPESKQQRRAAPNGAEE